VSFPHNYEGRENGLGSISGQRDPLAKRNDRPLKMSFFCCYVTGTDVMLFKIFSPKFSAKKLAFLAQNKAKLCKNLIITLVFEKIANFLAENWQKS
jgi:hypothetical protein